MDRAAAVQFLYQVLKIISVFGIITIWPITILTALHMQWAVELPHLAKILVFISMIFFMGEMRCQISIHPQLQLKTIFQPWAPLSFSTESTKELKT